MPPLEARKESKNIYLRMLAGLFLAPYFIGHTRMLAILSEKGVFDALLIYLFDGKLQCLDLMLPVLKFAINHSYQEDIKTSFFFCKP